MNRLRQWTTLALAPLWRWKWLFLACFLSTSYYAISAIRDNSFPSYLEQGWPRAYSVRFAPQVDLSPWVPFTHIQKLDLAALGGNISLAAAFSLFVVYLWHWHCERNGSWRRFDLKELLLITSLLATAMGATIYWRNEVAANERYLQDLPHFGWHPSQKSTNPPWYLQPQYDSGLLGRQPWSHTIGVIWAPDLYRFDINRSAIELDRRGENLPSQVTMIETSDSDLNDDGIAAISRWAPNCRRFYTYSLTPVSEVGVAHVARNMSKLEALSLWGNDGFSDECIAEIGKLRNLTWLILGDDDRKTHSQSLQHLKSLPRLKTLQVPTHWELTADDEQFFADRDVLLLRADE